MQIQRKLTVLILAAGQSRRMRGADKLMMDVDGYPLLRQQILRAQEFGPIYVALPSADHPRHAALAGTNATALIIPEAVEGMGGSLRGAMARLPEAGPVMLILGDLVDLRADDLHCIADAMQAHPDYLIWRGATTDGRAGHPIIFDGSLRPDFEHLSGDSGGESLVNPLRAQTYLHRFDDDRARYDLDTPEDWANWRKNRG